MIYEDDFWTGYPMHRINDPLIEIQFVYNKINESKKNLLILGIPGESSNWQTFVDKKFKKCTYTVDKILVSSRTESYNQEEWAPVIDQLVNSGLKYSDIMIVDQNVVSPVDNVTHGCDFYFLNRYKYYGPYNYVELSNRNYKFVSLAAIPRVNRIVFAKELLKRNLDKDGIITCGSDTRSRSTGIKLFDSLDLETYRSRFPLIHDNEIDSFKVADYIHEPFMDAVYNVVNETCFENFLNLPTNEIESVYRPRLSITEKTVKAFAMYQLPVFVASKGLVAQIRNLGFDLFDDIIDHSYDDIEDPYTRMVAVADEVSRLVKQDVPTSLDIKSRLLSNYNKIGPIYQQKKQDLALKILAWFKSDN